MSKFRTIATVIIGLLHVGVYLSHAQQPKSDRPIVAGQRAVIRPFVVWDSKPAAQWDHAYPVGNGRLGAMPFGSYPDEQILLNEDTIWGGRHSMQNRTDIQFLVEEIRECLFAGDFEQAHQKINGELLVPRITPRAFQPMGDLRIHHHVADGASVKNYRRALSMNDALAVTEFDTAGGNHIRQEVFSSWPDGVIVVRIESRKPNGLSLTVKLDRFADFETTAIDDRTLVMNGQAQHNGTLKGTRWRAAARVLTEEGRTKTDDRSIVVEDARAVTIFIAASTDYNPRRPFLALRHDRAQACLDTLTTVETVPYETLKARHVQDHQRFFRRATVELGDTAAETLALTTPQRISKFRGGGDDPDLIEDLFQMGRYMLIASSRPGTLPPNLTGIWNANPNPVCHSDWHTNINVQQNFWHAESTNLSELHEPFITLIDDIRKGQGHLFAEKLGCRGFLITHATHAWKEAAFSGSSWWGMWPMGGAWSTSHVMEHYRFTHDKDYLRETAFPILKDNVAFCLDWLVEHPKTGKLVSGPSASPENGFHIDESEKVYMACMGPTVDQMIVYESFTDFLEAASVLEVEDEFVDQVREARAKLARPQIANDGRIMEWDREYREWRVGHRHFSHLYGLHPGCEITPEKTPELFEAAGKSVHTRLEHGGAVHGWSRGHAINLLARLQQGDNAYQSVRRILSRHTLPNLMHTQPPIFFDGNGAGTGGIAEMLLQSHGGEMRLLPALPEAWPTGSFRGLRARGAFEIDLTWKDGNLAQATVRSLVGGEFRLRTDSEVDVRCGEETVNTTRDDSGCISVSTREGETYELRFTQGADHGPKRTPK